MSKANQSEITYVKSLKCIRYSIINLQIIKNIKQGNCYKWTVPHDEGKQKI